MCAPCSTRSTAPRHALVQAREFLQRDDGELAPTHRYRRGVPATSDPRLDHVEAVVVVHAVVFELCGGEVWEVVFRVHVLVDAFLGVRD